MDYKNHCRTCLGEGKQMRHVESNVSIGGSDVRLSDILHNFYNYKVSPNDHHMYPENICISCVHHLTLSYSFKTLIDSNLEILEQSANHVKSDSDSLSFDYESDEYKPEPEPVKIPQKRVVYKPKLVKNIRKEKPTFAYPQQSKPAFEKQIFCVECKEEFHTFKSLKEHCASFHIIKNTIGRECEYCSEKFDDFRELVMHRKLHMKPYLCETCWAGFFTESEHKTHTCQPNQSRRTKGNEKVLRQCDQCGKSYPAGYIKIHMATHGNEMKFSCKYCPKKFKVANSLNSHILWNHKRTRDHKCEVCGAMFISASARSTHVRKNHLKEKKYGCESCTKRFFSKSELQRHTLTHTGVKNFHCHLCDKSYQTRYGLNVHLKSHAHVNSGSVLAL